METPIRRLLFRQLCSTSGVLPLYAMIALQEGVRAEQKRIASYLQEAHPEEYDLENVSYGEFSGKEILYGQEKFI